MNNQKLTKLILLLFILLIPITSVFSQNRSKKKGLAYGYHSEEDMAAISKGISWWYNWYFQPESAVAAVYQNYGMDFAPMTWNRSFNEAGLRAFYASHPDAKYLLGFNEPNFLSQANIKPTEAAAAWPRLEKIAKDYGLKIVGPAVNYSGDGVSENGVTYSNPVTYLDAFFAACPNCQVDFIAVHNYMCYTSALTSYINMFKKYNRPIWLTEFACWDQQNITLDMQKNYMIGAIEYLEKEPLIYKYSWFNGNRSQTYPYLDIFEKQSGKLTELGNIYVNFNPVHDPELYTKIPARIEAENYTAMAGIGIEATKDVSGIANIGSIDGGDWMEYNIEVPKTGEYTLHLRIAALVPTNIDIREDGELLKTVQVNETGGYQIWATVPVNLNLLEGKHIIKLFSRRGYFNLNWIEFTNLGQSTNSIKHDVFELNLFPNPVFDNLNLELNNSLSKTDISIYNLTGCLIFTEQLNSFTSKSTIDLSRLKPGTYNIKISNQEITINKLIIKL